ncbi:MAG: nuclear transport factor 2 family protein [Halioglobus sp.]
MAQAVSDQEMRQFLDKQAITEVVFRYARAIDRLDEPLLRSVFHPDSQHNHFYEGPSSAPDLPSTADNPGDFVAFAFGALTVHTRTHHQMGNTLIEFKDDDSARVETYFTAFHRMRARGDSLAADNAHDTEMDYFVGGRYIDQFERRDGEWKIVHRVGMTDWMRVESPASQGFDALNQETVGQRAPDDYIYKTS